MQHLGLKALAAANVVAATIPVCATLARFPGDTLAATARHSTTLQVIANDSGCSGDYGTLNSWSTTLRR